MVTRACHLPTVHVCLTWNVHWNKSSTSIIVKYSNITMWNTWTLLYLWSHSFSQLIISHGRFSTLTPKRIFLQHVVSLRMINYKIGVSVFLLGVLSCIADSQDNIISGADLEDAVTIDYGSSTTWKLLIVNIKMLTNFRSNSLGNRR